MQQKITFTSGLNTDTAYEIYPAGASPFRLNTRTLSSSNGKQGIAETVSGNTLVSFTLPTGNNTCIGYEYFPEVKKGYAFIYNSTGKHSILEFDSKNRIITSVLQDKNTFDSTLVALNFKKGYLVTGIDLVILDSNNHLLYFTDGYVNPSNASDYNEPKKLNIQKAKLYMSSSGTDAKGYPAPFDKHWIDAIKKPPQRPSYVWSGLSSDTWDFVMGGSDYRNIGAGAITQIFPLTVSPATLNFWLNFNLPIGVNENNQVGSDSIWTAPNTGYTRLEVKFPVWQDAGTTRNIKCTFSIRNVDTGDYIVKTSPIQLQIGGVRTTVNFGTIVDATEGQRFAVYAECLNYSWQSGNYINCSNIAESSTFGTGTYFRGNYIGTELPNTRNDLFKVLPVFQSSWIYDDKEESVLSKISNWVMPRTVGIDPSKNSDDYYKQDDTITVTLETGSPIVTDINVYVKKLTEGNVLSDAMFVTRLNKKQLGIADNTTYDFTFKNDGTYTPINLAKANQLFDNIPYHAKSQEIFKNRIGYGAPTELTDAVNVDVRMPISYEGLDEYSENPYFPKRSYFKSGGSHIMGIAYYGNGGRVGTTNTVSGDSMKLQNMGTYGTIINIPFLNQSQYDAPKDNIPTFLQYVPVINGLIYHEPPKEATHYEWIWSKNQNISKYLQFVSNDIKYLDEDGYVVSAGVATRVEIDIKNIINFYKKFNKESQLVYDWTKGDRIRFIAGFKPSEGSDNLTTLYDYNDTEIYDFNVGSQTLNIRMSDGVPAKLEDNVLFEIYSPANLSGNANQLMYETGCGGTITTQFNSKQLVHTPSVGKSQEFLSFTSNVRKFANPEIFTINGRFTTLPSVGDNVKIKGTGGWSIYGVITSANSSSITVDTTGFELFNSTSYNTSGGDLVIAAEQAFDFGDTFRRKCCMIYQYPISGGYFYGLRQYIETMDASNMFDSQAWSYGRPNRIDNNSKRIKRPATIVYSERNIQETNINGLNKIYDGNFESYENDFGDIWKLFYRNEQLEAYQELKVAPIPVGQQVITTSSGQQSLTTSNAVLGKNRQFEYYDALSGIGQHPESFATNGARRYYFDVNNGAVFRLSTDGQTDISETAGMKKYFSDLSAKILKATAKVNVYGVYDIRHDSYVLSVAPFEYQINQAVIGESTGTLFFSGATIAYHEPSKMWSDAYSYRPDFIGQNGIDIVTFKNGALYTHDDNSLQATFYGQFTAPELWVVMNDNPSNVKNLLAVSLETNKAWECYSISTIHGQESSIRDKDFQFKENMMYANVLMDKNTKVALPLFNGAPMKDTTFLLKFRYNSPAYTQIAAINLLYSLSDRSNK